MCDTVEEETIPDNMIEHMLKSEGPWRTIENIINRVIKTKHEDGI